MATKPPVDPNLAAVLAQVKAMVAPQQDALLAQKKQAAEDARNQGIGLQAAYAAAAAQAAPLAGQIGDTYSQAAGAQAAFAKGFSDHIQQALGQSADQANQLLAQNGSPQHIAAPNVSDVLYGLGGYQPATLLNTSGAAFKTAAQQYPDTLRGLGLQGYEQAQAQGAVNQRSIQDKLDELNATRPQLVQQTLSGLQDAAERRREFNLNYSLSKQKANEPQIVGSSEGGYYAVSPDGKSITQVIEGTGPAPQIIGTDATGRYLWDSAAGTFTPLPGGLSDPVSKAQTRKPRFTPKQISDFKNKAATAAKFAYTGEKDPDTGEWLSEPQHYQTALATMVDHGIPLSIAQQALNRYWKKPGFDFDVEQRKQGKFVPARATKGLGRPLKSFQERNPGKGNAAAEPAAFTGKWAVPRAGVNIARVDPRLLSAVDQLGAYLGKPITIESGYRDNAKQAALYQRYVNSGRNIRYIAAKPGQSNHNRGEALDLTINGVPISQAVPADVLARFGLHNPVKGDLPHTTLIGVNG